MNVVVVGGNGGIGSALVNVLAADPKINKLFSFSRCQGTAKTTCDKVIYGFVDLERESSIQQMGNSLEGEELDLVIVASGLLHDQDLKPEKSLRALQMANMQRLFMINSIAPALIAQQLIPKLRKRGRTVFSVISARVGSISDNRLGGWYSYRASKAALNMLLKTTAIEVNRTHPDAIICGLHPGTVDTSLSSPFQKNVPENKLFSPQQSAGYLLDVISKLESDDSGKVFAWDGDEIPA